MSDHFQIPVNSCIDTAELPLTHRTLPADQTVAGPVRVGAAQSGQIKGVQIGVWEISAGTSTDVEIDEFFIVLSGEATVMFSDGNPPLQLRAGMLGRLKAGTATTWTVTKTLRKVYIA